MAVFLGFMDSAAKMPEYRNVPVRGHACLLEPPNLDYPVAGKRYRKRLSHLLSSEIRQLYPWVSPAQLRALKNNNNGRRPFAHWKETLLNYVKFGAKVWMWWEASRKLPSLVPRATHASLPPFPTALGEDKARLEAA